LILNGVGRIPYLSVRIASQAVLSTDKNVLILMRAKRKQIDPNMTILLVRLVQLVGLVVKGCEWRLSDDLKIWNVGKKREY